MRRIYTLIQHLHQSNNTMHWLKQSFSQSEYFFGDQTRLPDGILAAHSPVGIQPSWRRPGSILVVSRDAGGVPVAPWRPGGFLGVSCQPPGSILASRHCFGVIATSLFGIHSNVSYGGVRLWPVFVAQLDTLNASSVLDGDLLNKSFKFWCLIKK